MTSRALPQRPSRSSAARQRRAGLRDQVLAAAEDFLASQPLAELTIDAVMARTGLARTNFYRLFQDREDLLLQVLEQARQELEGFSAAWMEGTGPVADDLEAGIRGVVTTYTQRGAVFRAFAEGAGQEERLGAAWRGVLDDFVAAGRQRIERDRRAGFSRVADAESTARALVLMTEAFMRRALEDGELDEERVIATLLPIWIAAVRGAERNRQPRNPATG